MEWFSHQGRKWKVRVCCKQCAGNIYERATTHHHDCINNYESENEAEAAAIKEWNTRHERTCHMEYREGTPSCSECGRELDYDSVYCDMCGAKVVEE